jgi:hypothetical protein
MDERPCVSCERERARAARVENDLRLKEEQERGLLREIARLKGELTKQERARVAGAEVQQVFDHWADHPKRTGRKAVLGESRKKLIRDRIRELRENDIDTPVDHLKRAIDGLMSRPYVKTGGGRTADPRGAKRYASIEHALRDEKAIETCVGYLEKPDNVVPLRPRETHDPFHRPLDRAVAALRREFGSDAVYGRFADDERQLRWDEWWSVCPVQRGLGQPMRIREVHGIRGNSLDVGCAHGCLPSQLLDAISVLEDKMFEARVEIPVSLGA